MNDKHICLCLFKCFREAGDDRFAAYCFSDDSILLSRSLSKFGFVYSPLSSSDVECLALVLVSKPYWETLSLHVSDVSIEILHQLLATNAPTVDQINLDLKVCCNNILSSNLITKIALLCKTKMLSITGTFCTATIVTSLKENKFLKVLYLEYYSQSNVEKAKLLDEQSLQGLKYIKILEKLVICGCFFHPEQCRTIGQQMNRSIKVQIMT